MRPAALDLAILRAVLARLIPADDGNPGALEQGTDAFVVERLAGEAREAAAPIAAGLAGLDQAACEAGAAGFAWLDARTQDELLRAVERRPWFLALNELCALGFYADPGNGGNRDARSWAMIGYEHRLPEGPDGPPAQAGPRQRLFGPSGTEEFDVVIVGAGAGGGVAACVLAEAGKSVLLLERGELRSYSDSGRRDHLRNHRFARFGHNSGPEIEGNPRVFVDPHGREHVMRPFEYSYSNNAAAVGSGTLLYGGLAWRFHPDDFRMASRYGVPEGSSLADWPISYDDLEAWYGRAEYEIGVAGSGATPDGQDARHASLPMPPMPQYEAARVLAAGAERLGMETFAPPLLVNSVPRDGRAACIQCASCVGFPCPSDAKNGTQNTVIPRALATGRCRLVTRAMATRVLTDDTGRVTGVAYSCPGEDGGMVHATARARAVVLSAGAIETARLLLASASDRHPAGLGNHCGMVGRNLQGHIYPTAFGLFDADVHDCRGPGVTIASCAYNHGNDGIIGGAMLADDFVMLPAIFWSIALPPELRRWGGEAKSFMRDHFRHVLQVKGPVQEIPNPECRVTLDPNLRDRHGMPVARLSGVVHPETMRTVRFMLDRAHDWLDASGARRSWSTMPAPRLSAHQHQAGTCRMGAATESSVTDKFGRVWGHENLFVCDASLHPTNGGFNPVLTIMALAFRNASHIAESL